MHRFTLAAGLAALAAASSASGQISFLGSFGGKDYYVNDTPLSWTNARAAALAHNPGFSDLIALNSAAEAAFLAGLISPPPPGPVYWIGLNKAANPNGGQAAFVWVTGEPVTYTNWAGDAVFNDPLLNYTSWNWSDPGRVWNNLQNDGTPFGFKRSIIEVVPAPSSCALLGLGALVAGRRRR